MHCPSCGKENTSEAKFCGGCGYSLSSAAPQNEPQVQAASETAATVSTQPLSENHYVKQGKVVGKMFGGFFVASLKAPFKHAKTIQEATMTNGLIAFFLFSLLFPLISYIEARRIAITGSVPFGSIVVSPTIVMFLALLTMAGVILISLKLMQVNASYKVLVNRLGSLLSLPIALLGVSFLFSLMSMTLLSMLFMIPVFIIVPISIYGVIFSYDNTLSTGLDPFYGVLTTMIGFTIISVVVFMVAIDSMINRVLDSVPFLF
ncbi:zinc ribbon domain-containing protein [Salipaludibacillus keqinensis]|nr:zinc ribbon domain-containing protein [Salipaludibacillus keqinensis]